MKLWQSLLSLALYVLGVNGLQSCKLPVSRVARSRGTLSGLSAHSKLANTKEYAYMVKIQLGDQDFSALLDTGSSDFWIVSTDCTSPDCAAVARYSANSSRSLIPTTTPFVLTYLLGSVTGYVAYETVFLGIYEIASQAFAIANNTQDLGLSATGNSGVLGLCFPSSASIPATAGKTLLENLFASFAEDQRFFAFKLGRQTGLTDPTSSFTIGELDTEITNVTAPLSFYPVVANSDGAYDYWKLSLKRLTINGTVFPLSPSLVPGATNPIAVLDTGTTLMLGPTVDVDAFWNSIGSPAIVRKSPTSGMWEVRCERSLLVGLVLGDDGREYPIDPQDTNWDQKQSADGWCTGGIQANDGVVSGDWLLGDIFLRNVYVVHHGANSTHPPLIGLTNVTDPQDALQRFRDVRGADVSPPITLHIQEARGSKGSSSMLLYTLSSAGGFVGGGIITYLVRLHLRRRAYGRVRG
ncbi:acid protease [Schizophyllum commune Tattone D]|nr:acid protease [Schizophyllum commune Tattone D]